MRYPRVAPNTPRDRFRVWINGAIESGLFPGKERPQASVFQEWQEANWLKAISGGGRTMEPYGLEEQNVSTRYPHKRKERFPKAAIGQRHPDGGHFRGRPLSSRKRFPARQGKGPLCGEVVPRVASSSRWRETRVESIDQKTPVPSVPLRQALQSSEGPQRSASAEYDFPRRGGLFLWA